MPVSEWITIAIFVVNLAMLVIGLKIKSDFRGMEIALERRMEQGEAELRESLREVELYMRDNFVRKASFDKMIELMTTQMQAQFDRLYAKVDRLNDKLDRQNGQPG